MSYALIFGPTVARELRETIGEREVSGRDLLAELAAVFDKIQERPRRFPIVHAQVHRALTRRFHFSIFFRIDEGRREVVILAVLHQRRDPALWPKR